MKTDIAVRMLHVAVLIGCLRVVESYTIRDPAFSQPTRACGHKLAEVLSLVCKNGYYQYFATPVDNSDSYKSGRRLKRGIVDECCHSGCSVHTLEQYCIPPTTEAPDNSQIRKRSDNEKSWQESNEEEEEEDTIPKSGFPHFPPFTYDNIINQAHNEKEIHNSEEVKDEPNKEKNLLLNLIMSKTLENVKQIIELDEHRNRITNQERFNEVQENHDMAKDQQFDPEMIQTNLNRFSTINRLTSRERDVEKEIEKNDVKPMKSDQIISDHRLQSFEFIPHGKRLRHHNDKHHFSKSESLNMQNNNQEIPESKQKHESRSVVSRVGIEDEYFLGKESVHPKVIIPSMNIVRHVPHNT